MTEGYRQEIKERRKELYRRVTRADRMANSLHAIVANLTASAEAIDLQATERVKELTATSDNVWRQANEWRQEADDNRARLQVLTNDLLELSEGLEINRDNLAWPCTISQDGEIGGPESAQVSE